MEKTLPARGVSDRRIARVLEDIRNSNSHGFQSHVATELGDCTPQAVYMVLKGKSPSKRIAEAIVRLWPCWKRRPQRAAA